MGAAGNPRYMSLPHFALRRDEAAAAVGISSTVFDRWVKEGRMPKGRKIGGVVLWDTQEVKDHWILLKDGGTGAKNNPFNGIVV